MALVTGCGKAAPETPGAGPGGSQGPSDPGSLLGPGTTLKSTGMSRSRAPKEAEFPVYLERAGRTSAPMSSCLPPELLQIKNFRA